MLRVVDSGRARLLRTVSVVVVLVALVASSLLMAVAAGLPAVSASGPRASFSATPAPTAHPTTHSSAPAKTSAHPQSAAFPSANPSDTVPFWGNNSTFGTNQHVAPSGGGSCQHYLYSYYPYNYSDNYCYSGFTNPNSLLLGNGHLGVGYSYATQATPPGCISQPGNLSYVVAFQSSSNGGVNFGSSVNVSTGNCQYFNAIEPSFTVASTGTVDATWVAENYTLNPQYYYSDRSTDGLAFSTSTNNGGSWSASKIINANGNIARPQVTTFGSTIYVLYENNSNSTAITVPFGMYGQCCAAPIALDLIYSTNGGSTWNGPYTLPGENATAGYTEFGGWLSVNKTGMLGVSYFTNQSCVNPTPYSCYEDGADLVYSTSTNNGSSWAAPFTIAKGFGESEGYMDGVYLNNYIAETPSSQFVFSADGQTAYIVWEGGYNKNSPYYYDNYNSFGIFSAVGSPLGTGWSTKPIQASMDTSVNDDVFNPGIAWVGTTLYVTFTWANLTYCYGSTCPPNENTFSQWESSSTDGMTWSSPALVDFDRNTPSCTGYYCFSNYFGLHSSVVGLNATTPVFGFTLGLKYTYTDVYFSNGAGYNYYFNESYSNRIEVGFPYSGPTVTVNFTEINLPVGTNWSFSLNGFTISSTSPSINITNIPRNVSVTVLANNVPAGYNTIIAPGSGVNQEQTFSVNSTLIFNYSVSYGLTLFYQPAGNVEYGELEAYIGGTYTNDYWYFYNESFICTGCSGSFPTPNFPWYFAAGTTVTIHVYSEGVYPAFWNGTGTGNFTGSGMWANITMGSPINETAWWASIGSYNVQVNPIGLTSASTYSFAFDGVTHSALGNQSVTLKDVITGAHTLTDISATSSTTGWGYVGYSTPASPILEPVSPIVNLSFAYIDLAASPGVVNFTAQGLTSGTVWHFAFNGTTYSSSTPWINVNTRPGTFPVQAFPVTSLNSSVGYTPTGVAKTMSVTTGSTYTIDYVQAYNVRVGASLGGSVSGASSSWLASGATASYVATAHANYAFGGWTGLGLGSYTGTNATASITANGPILESAVFYPLTGSRFNLTFVETGLAAGTWWSVALGGMGFATNNSTLVVHNLLSCSAPGSNYALTIPYAYSADGLTRFVPTSHLAGTVCTTGTTVVNEVFAPQYRLTLQSTAGGYAEATIGTALFTTSQWVASGTTVTLDAVPQAGYNFLGWNGTGAGSFTGPGPSTQETIVMAGPVTELASFALPPVVIPPTFTLDFHLVTALAAGTSWSIVFNGTGYSSTGTDLLVSGLHTSSSALTLSVGTSLSPDGLTQYTPLGVVPTVTVTHNQTVQVSFATSYWVSVSSTAGGVAKPSSEWIAASGSILLNATAFVGYDFAGWTGTGVGSYTGGSWSQTVKVTGPITEIASFTPHVQPSTSNTGGSTSSVWANPLTWAGLAAVGLLVGLVVGLLVARGRRRPPASSAPRSDEEMPPATDSGSTMEGSQ